MYLVFFSAFYLIAENARVRSVKKFYLKMMALSRDLSLLVRYFL